MTFKQLEYVLAIAKCGSLSQAAAQLYISQPALSEAIQNLEDELGFSIFSRSHVGMSLTSEGEAFIADSQSVVEQMAYIEHRYTMQKGKRHHFSVSSTHFYFTQTAFVQLTKGLQDRYTLRYLDSRKLDVLDEVACGISEIGVLSYTEESRPHTIRKLKSCNLEYEILRVLQPVVFFSASHPLAKRETLRVEDLKPYPCTTFYQGPTTPRLFEEEIYQLPEWDRMLVMQDNGAITVFLLETDCFSIGSGIVPKCIQGLGICAVPIVDIPPSTIIWVKRRGHELSEIAQQYLLLCKESLFADEPAIDCRSI